MNSSSHSNRVCLHCGYSLEHLGASRCPECGGEFDPMDPRTFAVRRRPSRGWLMAAAVMWFYPIGLFLTPYFAWLFSWVSLGRQPQPGLDDPKDISLLVDGIQFIYFMLLIAFPLAVMLGVVANLWLASVFNLRVSRMLLVHLGFILLWIGAIALARLDPGNIGTWFVD